MTTLTLKINDRTKRGQALIEFLKQYVIGDKNVEVVKMPNEETIKAIEEVESGKVIKAKNAADLIRKLNC
jgi:antitoxin component of RelBE/YafQ-DinJ toxin-antitoxin module